MATSAKTLLLLDTSAALAFVNPDHVHHAHVQGAARGYRLGLSGHAVAETLSVLTRLPAPQRLTGNDAVRLIVGNFPDSRYLDPETTADLWAEFAAKSIVGGSVYDGLVAAAARNHRHPLLTCDRRAVGTYERLGIDYHLVT